MKKNVLFKTALLLVVMLFSFWGNVSAQTWQMVDLSELTATDVFVIVDITSGCAMPNNKGTSSAPNAVSVTVNGDHLEGDIDGSLKWNISGNGTDGYIFYPNGTTEKWLYCSVNAGTTSGSNNNMRVGTGENKTFILHNNNWLAHVYSSNHTRYVGVYNSSEGPQDWRGYNNTSSNVANTQTRFFKYTEAVSTVATMPGVAIWYLTCPWQRNRWDLALIILAFIITSMSPSDLFPREIWRQLIKPYSIKALPIAIIWFKLIYEMMTKDYDLATAQIMRTQANVMQ